MAFKYKPESERFPKPGFMESAARNAIGGAGNVVGLLGAGAGQLTASAADSGLLPNPFGLTKSWGELSRDAGLWLSEQAQKIQQPAQLDRRWEDKGLFDRATTWNYWTDPQGATADVVSGIFASIPFMGAGIGLRAAGAVLPTKQIANRFLFELGRKGGKIGQGVNNFARTNLGKALGETADAGINYAATIAPLDAMTNSAEIIKPLKERGFTDNEISRLMLGSMAEEMPTDLAANFLTGNTILGKGFGLRGRTWKGRLGYGSLNIPLEMLGEYKQEGDQTRATQKYQGVPYTENPIRNLLETGEMYETPEERSAATSGAIGAIIPAAGGTAYHAAFGNDKEEPAPTEKPNKALRSWTGRNTGGAMSDDVHDTIIRAAEKYGVPVERALAAAMAESNGDRYAVSPVGAIGVMQLMPETAQGLGVDPYDMEQNIDGGVRYLKQMYDQFGDWGKAHAAYNAGAGAVERYGGIPDYPETQGYVSKINGYLNDLPDWQGGEESNEPNEQDEDIYVGENGAAEGNYWLRQGDHVSFEGAQPELLNAIDMLAKYYYDKTGKRLVVTAGTNGTHAEGEHSHGAGWKVDVNDFGFGEDGALTTPDGGKGWFADEFIAYGRSLGLGMNWEGGADNAHIDVALDGTQWDGSFDSDAGGFNPQNGRSARKSKSEDSKTEIANATPPDEIGDIEPTKPVTFGDIINDILRDNDNAQFDSASNDDGTQDILSDFAEGKKDTATGEAALKLQEMFDDDGNFIQSRKNRQTLDELFGDELKEFGQGKLNQRWSDLLKKSMQPDFIENLTDDDKKFFGNILKHRLKESGIDFKGMSNTLQGLERGDEKTFVNAWQALQDRLKQSEEAEPLISDKTQKALDDIAQRIDELTTSGEDNSPQIAEHSKLYREISKLEGDINKLNAEREKLSRAKGNQAARVDAAGKIAKIDKDIRNKQADLDARIDNFYNPPQPATPEQSKFFAPVKEKADNAIENLNKQIETLRAQGLDDTSDEIDQIKDTQFDIKTLTDKLADFDAQIMTAKQQKASAGNDAKARGTAKAQQEKATTAYKKTKKALDNILNSLAEPTTVQENFTPINNVVADELAAIKSDKDYLKNNGGTSEEINSLIKRQNKIKADNNSIVKDMNRAEELKQQIHAETSPQRRDELEDQLISLNAKIQDKTNRLSDYIKPAQPATPEQSKFFAPVKEKADNAIENLNQRIETLRTQGLADDSDEIEQLTDKKMEIQAAVDRIAKFDADAETAKKRKAEAKEANDANAYAKADKQRKAAVNSFKKSKADLEALLNPSAESTPKQEHFDAYDDTIENALTVLSQNKAELRNTGATATDKHALNQRIRKIHNDNDEIIKLNMRAEELEQQLQTTTDSEKRSEIEDKIDALRADVEGKVKKLHDYISPPQRPEKTTPKKYDALPDEAKEELRKVNRKLLDMPDLGGTGNGESSTSVKDLTARREKLVKFNNDIGQLQDRVLEAGEAWANVRDSEDENEKAKVKGAFETAKENLAAKRKELDKFLAPSAKKEKQPAPFVPYDEETRNRINDLNNRIDEEQNASAINDMRKEREAIQNQSGVVSDLQKKLQAQEAVMNDATKSVADKREAKETYAAIKPKFDAEKEKLNNLLHPQNEDEEPAEIYPPVNDSVKDALEEFDRRIAQAQDGSAEKANLQMRRRELENQNETVAKLRDERNQLEKDLSRKQVGSKGYKKVQNALDNKNRVLANAEKKLSKLIEIPKTKEKKQEQPKQKKHEPPTAEAKKAIETLKRGIKKLNAQIENAETDYFAGKSDGKKLKELTDSREEKKSLLRDIQAQSDKCAELKDQAAMALRIMNDSTKPQAERDKAGKTLADYGSQLREELQRLHELIPQEQSEKTKTVKEKKPSKVKSVTPDQNETKANRKKSVTNIPLKTQEAEESPEETQSQKTSTEAAPTTAKDEIQAKPKEKSAEKKSQSKEVSVPVAESEQEESTQDELPKLEESAKSNKEEYKTDDGSIFGSVEAAEKDMLEVFKELGIETKSQATIEPPKEDKRRPKLLNFVKDDSDEALEREIEELKKKLNKVSSMPMFNPEIWKSALKIGAIYVQRGINNFADWAARMTESIGTEIKPWQSAIWETINELPEGSKFNEKQIMTIAKYIGALQEKGTVKTFEDVREQFGEKFGKDATEKILPMIRASYTGVEKFFAERKQQESRQDEGGFSNVEQPAVEDEQFPNADELEEQTEEAANKGEQDTSKAELAKGYRTESGRSLKDADKNEFIIKPDGTKDFGEINEEIAIAANNKMKQDGSDFRFKAAPVRLQVGTEDTIDENGETIDGFGYKHILEHIDEIKVKGFDNITSYVEHILKNFNQVYKANREENRIILYCKGDPSKGLMPLDLELEKGKDDYYTIVTAYPRRKAKKEDTLLLDVRPANTSTDTASVPHLQDSNDESGVAPRRDIVESNVSSEENITQGKQSGKANANKEGNIPAEDELMRKAYKFVKQSKLDKKERLKILRENDGIDTIHLGRVQTLAEKSQGNFKMTPASAINAGTPFTKRIYNMAKKIGGKIDLEDRLYPVFYFKTLEEARTFAKALEITNDFDLNVIEHNNLKIPESSMVYESRANQAEPTQADLEQEIKSGNAKNPFDVELPENPSGKFKQAYNEILATWEAYRQGDLDILEAAHKVKESVEKALYETIEEARAAARDYEIDILRTIEDKIKNVKLTPQQQEQESKAWQTFFVLKRAFDFMHKAGKVDDEEYRERSKAIRDLERQLSNGELTATTAQTRIVDLLPEEFSREDIENYFATSDKKKEATLFRVAKGDIEATDVFYSDAILNMEAIERGLENGELEKLLEKLPQSTINKAEQEVRELDKSSAAKSKREEAIKQINGLIEKWKPRNYQETTDPPTALAENLVEMVSQGVIKPDEAVDAANKLLNGTKEEYVQAWETYKEALWKLKDKRAEEFNPAEGIARLNKIAKKFPVLKEKVEEEIKAISDGKGGKLVNNDLSLTSKDDDKVEQWATYKLIDKWSKPYKQQLNSGVFTTNDTVAWKIYDAAHEIRRQAEDGKIPTQGIYEQVDELLNAPHEGLQTDEQWRQKNAVDARVEYLFFKGKGEPNLQAIRRDFEKILGKELAEENAPQIEAAYNELIGDARTVSATKNSKLERGRGAETEKALAKAFDVRDKQDSQYERVRREIYKKLDADNHPQIKEFLDRDFYDVYVGRFKDVTVDKLRKFTPEQTETFERQVALFNKKQRPIETSTQIDTDALNETATPEEELTDPIEQRAREALKETKLEGKTAPEQYTSRVISNTNPHDNMVEIATRGKIPDSNLKRKITTLAHNFNGMADDRVDWGYNFYAKGEAQAFKKALDIYFGTEEATADVEESETGARLDDGYRDVESAVRAGAEEEIRQAGRVEISDEDTGQERRVGEGVGARDTESNAESDRPAQENDAGSASTRAGTGAGVRGDKSVVQPAAGAERGSSNVPADVDESAIEERARAALKAAGLEGGGAFESQGFSVEVEPIGEGAGGKNYSRVSINMGKELGLTNADKAAYEKIAKQFNAQQDEIKYTSYICANEDAPALKRAFEIYLENSTDERIKDAFENLKAQNNFTDEQLKWLDRIERYIHAHKAYGRLKPEDFDAAGTAFQKEGGFERINELIEGKLADILTEINAHVYDKKREAADVEESTAEKTETKAYEAAGHNFHIAEDSGIGEGGLKEKFKQNVAAIKLLKQLEAEGRKATPNEQAILAKFNGWGTLRKAFTDDKDWQKENQQLKELLTAEEYESARAASPNAFYTQPEIARTIWSGLERLGFKGGRILDPSMGSGIFFGTMPNEFASRSELSGVELDSLTGRIAQQLYQNTNVEITGFQDKILPNNYFDLAISNVPFGTITYRHKGQKYDIHNYFFAKAMDKVRPGGLVAFITGTGTMQSGGNSAVLRAILNGQADLIAAYKLPGNAFEKNAGTQVTTDVLILQKRVDPKTPSEYAQDWSEIGEYGIEKKSPYYTNYTWTESFPLNKYFLDNPDHMLGTPTEDTLYGGRSRLGLDGKGRDVIKELGDLMSKLPENIYRLVENPRQSTLKNTQKVIVDSTLRDKSFVLKDGKVYQARQHFNIANPASGARELVEVPKANQERVKDFIALEKATDNLLMAQLDPATTDEKLFNLRQRLNKNYDAFVEKHGYVNSPENVKVLGEDPNFGRVASIEDYRADKQTKEVTVKKADIFSKRTVGAMKEPTSANNVNDALAASLSTRGRLDIDYMAKLMGKSEREVVKELGDQIFENPVTNQYELAEEYLSGNVREKLAAAEQAARHNPNYKRNVAALRKVQPIDLTEDDIKVTVGAPWIDVQYYNQFLSHMLGARNGYHIEHNKALGKWTVVKPDKKRVDYMTMTARNEAELKNTQTWGIEEIPFTEIFDRMLNLRPLVVKEKETYVDEKSGKKKTKTVTNEDATTQLKAKAKEIQAEFVKWLWSDDARKADLLKTFNEEYNSEIERRYDGSRLEFHEHGLAANIEMRPHQKDAIWRVMQGKNTLLAHTVGAGKTWEMVVSAMEMKRLGLIRKPLFVLPQNLLRQFEKEFLKAYSHAKLLVLEAEDLPGAKIDINFDERLDTQKHGKQDAEDTVLNDEAESAQKKSERLAKRRAALSRISTEDWDGIIISHSLFKSMPMSAETYKDFYREMQDSLRVSYQILKERGENKTTLSQIEQAIRNLETKLQEDVKEHEKEVVLPFEELGIDQIFVDEADKFKNLKIPTAMGTISGLQTDGSQRSLDLYLKTKWLSKMRNGGGVVFATGTPVSNSLGEIFTMQRYLDTNTLAEKDWNYFDSWAAMFTEKEDIVEMNPDGSGLRQNTYLTLQNLRILSRMFRKFADIKLPQDLPFLKRPALKNGQRTIVEVEPTEEFIKKRAELTERAQEARHTPRGAGRDNMLAVTNDMRKASIDLQMLDPTIPESKSGNKIPTLCDKVAAKYKETAAVKGAQLIFSDIGTPQGKNKRGAAKTKSVYEKIKRGLIERGIPAKQIAFVHDAKDSVEKQALFERVNNGEIRVILGSTEMMGAGTNFQKHLVALHHLDVPWRPRDIEQREGRILRNGNQNAEVEIFTYVTKGSYDANMWEKVKRKKEMIDSFMSGDPTVDKIVESPDALTFGEAMAAAMDNPLLKERTDLGNKVTELEILARAHRKQQATAKLDRDNLLKSIPTLERQIKDEEADVAEMTDITGDNFKMKLGDKIYRKSAEAKETFETVLAKFDSETSTKVGEIGGFDIKLRAEKIYSSKSGVVEVADKNVTVQLVNHGSYSVEKPTLNGLRGVMKALSGWLNADKVELAKQKSRLAEDEKQIKQPFKQAAELEEMRHKLADVDAKIKALESAKPFVEAAQGQQLESSKEPATEQAEEVTAEQINEAAKNPDTANALKQLGAQIEDGKVSVSDEETQQAVENHIKTMTAWHGSPHKFDTFSTDKIGTGEGAQVHGWGLYFAKNQKTAEGYKGRLGTPTIEYQGKDWQFGMVNRHLAWIDKDGNELTENAIVAAAGSIHDAGGDIKNAIKDIKELAKKGDIKKQDAKQRIDIIQSGKIKYKKTGGSLFKVDIPDSSAMLDFDKPLSTQSSNVKQTIKEIANQLKITIEDDMVGSGIYHAISDAFGKYIDSPMKASKLLNEHGVKGITYDGKSDGRCYVVFDDKAIKVLEKFSIRGAGNKEIKNFVDPKDLTEQQKILQRLGKDIGVRVVFFDNKNGDFHGSHAGNVSYLNVNSKTPLNQVFWHEAGHWLKANNPELYKALVKAANITDAQRQAYLAETGRTDLTTADAINEEIIADYMEDILKREGFLSDIGRKDKSLIERVVAWLQDMMSKFREYFQNPQGKLTNSQAQRMAHEFGRMAKNIVDQNGKKIFRYNSRTHALTLPDGRSLRTLSRTTGAAFDFSQGIVDNDEEISQRVFDKYLTDGLMKIVRNAVEKEIGEQIDLSKMSDPVARDEARDKLPYIKQMLTRYNLSRVQKDEAYKNRLAVKIEYARRCFDNDGRIQNEALRQVDGYEGQSGIHETGLSAVPRNNTQGTGRQLRGINVRVSSSVSGGKSAARKHFLKLYEAAQEKHSVKRGVFSVGDKSATHFEPRGFITVPATAENRSVAEQFGGKFEDGRLTFDNVQDADAYTRHLANMEREEFKYLLEDLDGKYFQAVDNYRNAKTDTDRQAALKKLQDMVAQAAEAAGFHNAVPEQTVAYKVRTTAAPKKTIKVYKVFTVASDGSPTALFIGGTEKLPQGVWLDAQDAYHFKAKNNLYYVPSTQNPFTKGGKTGGSVEIPDEATRQELIKRGFLPKSSKATKITALAYRPGWHAGTLPFFPQGGMKRTGSNYENIHRYNQVVFECELAAEKNYTTEAEAQHKARNKDGSLNSRKADLQRMPENGFYYYATNPLTHGHPELGMWAISGSLKIGRALTQEECDKILAENGKLPQEWEQGKLDLAELGYTGEQNDSARKTLAPITYDDNGEIIPLSQRFDPDKDDIRYSFAGERVAVAEGYYTESGRAITESDSKEFIVDENGNRNMGEIPKEIEQKTNGVVKSAPVRLQVGVEKSETQKGFGYVHIFKHINEIQARGFSNIPSYVKHILNNFNQVYQGKDSANRITLYCKDDSSKGLMPLDLELEKSGDNYYTVVTAYPRRRANKNETLLVDTRPTNVSTVAATVPHERNINDRNGVEASRDIVVSNASNGNIAQTEFAGNGELGKILAAAKVLTNAQLSGQQRKWVEFGKNLGVQVKWLNANPDLKGALKDGVIYLNRNGNDNVVKTFWHEQFHLTAALNPELYRDLLKYFSGKNAFTKEQLDAYRDENNRPDLTDAETIEEILSDNFGQVQKRVQLMRELGRDDSSLAERFITWLKYLADKIAATFRNPEGGMTTAQRDAFIRGISDLADSMQITDATAHEGIKFSASDKLKNKIHNVLTRVQNERPRNHMRKLLEKLSGYQIRSGHVAEGIDILVKDISKVIRTPNAYEWKKLLPEVGKLVAKKLNLNPTTEQGNYIASWLMDGAPNDTSQEAKNFQRAMRETDDMYRDQLLEVQGIFSEWANRPPEQIAKDVIAHGNETKPILDRAKGKLDEGYQQFVEELYPVKQLVDQYEKDNGKQLSAGENPYNYLRLLRGLAGRGKIMVEGDETSVDVLKRLFPNVNFNNFKTLNTILKSCGALDNEENQKEFSAYLLACAVKDLHKLNAANLRQQAELRNEIETLEDELDTLTDKKKIKAAEERIEKLQEELKALKKKIYATPFDEYETVYDTKVCDGTIAKYKDKYGQAQKDIVNYQRTLLDMLVDCGILSEEQKIGYMKAYPNHIPMFRKFDENEDKNFGDSLKAMTGSTRDIIDPIASLTKNTYDFVRRAEKNKAKCLLANLARTGGLGTIVEVDERTPLDEVDNKKPDVNTTITFYENGQKKYLDTDPAVVKAVNNLTIPQMSWFMKFLRVGTLLLRNFATVYNPAFAFRNLIMDNQNAMLYSKCGFFSPADFVRGFLSVWNRDADYNEWMAMGGAQASFWSVDRDYTQASLERLRKGRWGQYKSFTGAFKLLSILGEYSELGTRVGYYKKVKKALAEKNGGKIDTNILIEAALESRDLTDFARGGKTSRDWNSAVAFANASIQGWDKFARTYDPRQYWSKDPEVKKQWEHAMIRLALGSILPTVLLFMLNHDEDWYEEDLPDWERQTHWILSENIRVPKGQDVGLRFFSNLTESMLRSMANNDPKAFQDWWKPFVNSLPDICPTALQPIFECAANYDWFRKNAIVPMRQQRLPEYMQYDSRTSALAKGIGDSSLAKLLVGETGISPAKIDHFLYGYTGKLGQDVVRFGQNALGTVFGKDEWVNYSGVTDLPIISGMKSGFLRVPYRNPRIMNEFYETLDEQTKLHNEFKLTKKRPEGYDHNLYTRLNKAQKEMQEFTKKERKILDDPRLDGDERNNRQIAIQKRRVALAERILR